jgi:ElaB/YqjD/DUF883 family membrane-anchored ribosome-binding protein
MDMASDDFQGEGADAGAAGTAMDELLAVARELRDNLSRLFGATRGVAGEGIQRAREKGSDWIHRGRDRASQVVEGTNEYVREEPMKALLIAAGAGLLLGYLIKRSR